MRSEATIPRPEGRGVKNEGNYLPLPEEASEFPQWIGFSFDGWNAPLLNVPLGPGKVHRNGVHAGKTAWDQQYRDVGTIQAVRTPPNGEDIGKWIEEHYGFETARWYQEVTQTDKAMNGYGVIRVAVVSLAVAMERTGEPVTGILDVPGHGRHRLFMWKRDLGAKSTETGLAWRLVKN